MRQLFEYIAKLLYYKKYIQLKDRLLSEFDFLKTDQFDGLDTLSKFLISGEDHRFYHHIGFDIIAIFRAIRNRIFYNKIEGASTIEQQLVRVLTNDFTKTFERKIREIFLATTIRSIIPKSAIPKIYLNVAYYGTGMNGLNQAITKMGIKRRDIISTDQAAEIVSRIKYPQPTKPSQKRLKQIEVRKQHLLSLYNKHLTRKYLRIYG